MDLCASKNIFGSPNEGIHKYRLFNIAVIDVLATIIVAFLTSMYCKYNFTYVLIVLFVLGIISHYIFCVDTQVNKLLYSIIKKFEI